ncbi:arrestin domain-containing protein 1 [Drosophila biarmipes]|uniref:arrestin domain-containing protein 1 n=1 Tax=Drosophila biarmipes TaxID=125945 RepID=UPI0007E76260|nr:arrestin domain-containing protein 1 [Drosophila biarmipes]
MSSKVTFAFDNNPLGVYQAGQLISGTAELVTERPKTIRSIFITINGYGETRWQESEERVGEDGKTTKSLVTHTTTEVYYSTDQPVYGQAGGSQLELPTGKYVFPFRTTIPPNAPTSFNGEHGQIKHEVTLTIDRAVRYNNTFKQCFSVILPHDLNKRQEYKEPLQRLESKSFWWGSIFGAHKPMVMDVSTSYSAYVPGQKIHFHLVLDNQSDVQCMDVKVRLMKNVSYRANSSGTKEQLKVTESRVADKHCGEVLKHNKAMFDEYLVVPPTTPSTQSEKDPIRVSYTLRFIAKTFKLHGGGDLVMDFPLTIGTVPLLGSADDKGPGQEKSQSNGTSHPGSPNFMEDVSEEQFESNTFKPRYPVYPFDGKPGTNGSNGAANFPSLYPKAQDAVPPAPVKFSNPNPNPVSPATQKPPPYPTNGPAAGPPGGNFEVLGFSIPPDYKPTPSAPADANTGGIGWK